MARTRSGPSGNAVVSSDSAEGAASAAPIPWAARATNSTQPTGARPPTSELSAKRATPARKTRRRPSRSPARAPSNREVLVSPARDVFAAEGSDASMEAIARKAGVGVGTLYRHFPKRIDVVEAVYRGDIDELEAAAERAVRELEPMDAVEAFLL